MDKPPPKPPTSVTEQFALLEMQVTRIADLLETHFAPRQQPSANRRWRPSLRTYFLWIGLLAVLAAWFGFQLRQSRLQSQAVDVLLNQQAAIIYENNDSLVVSLLPGPPDQPPAFLHRSLGHDFFFRVSDVSVTATSGDPQTVIRASADLPQLRGFRLRGTPLTNREIAPIFSVSTLESIDLSRTRLEDSSIATVKNTSLRWADFSHTCLGDLAVSELSQCPELEYLNLDRTMVSDRSIEFLSRLPKLRTLSLNRTSLTPAGVKELAKQLPNCYITYQPLVLRADGSVDQQRCQRGSLTFGIPKQQDPRAYAAARPPRANAKGPQQGFYREFGGSPLPFVRY